MNVESRKIIVLDNFRVKYAAPGAYCLLNYLYLNENN